MDTAEGRRGAPRSGGRMNQRAAVAPPGPARGGRRLSANIGRSPGEGAGGGPYVNRPVVAPRCCEAFPRAFGAKPLRDVQVIPSALAKHHGPLP